MAPFAAADEVAAGHLVIEELPGLTRIVDLTVSTKFRGQGIATDAIRPVIVNAHANGRDVALLVEPGSPAMKLYARLGFSADSPSDTLSVSMRNRAS